MIPNYDRCATVMMDNYSVINLVTLESKQPRASRYNLIQINVIRINWLVYYILILMGIRMH